MTGDDLIGRVLGAARPVEGAYLGTVTRVAPAGGGVYVVVPRLAGSGVEFGPCPADANDYVAGDSVVVVALEATADDLAVVGRVGAVRTGAHTHAGVYSTVAHAHDAAYAGLAHTHAPGPDTSRIVGEVIAYAGPSAGVPAGWLLCDGSTVSTTTYAALFAILGTLYNTGGEAGGTFRVPDLISRLPMGADVANSSPLLGQSDGLAATLRTLAHTHVTPDISGSGSHLHTAGTLASDSRDLDRVTTTAGGGALARLAPALGTHSHTVNGSTATNTGHSHTVPDTGAPSVGLPFLGLHYLIKT